MFTPGKQSRPISGSAIELAPLPSIANGKPNQLQNLESTVASLEVAVLDSQSKCSTLMEEISTGFSSQHLSDIKQLSQKLESMQILLTRLRTQI